jgi:O-antigen ligase
MYSNYFQGKSLIPVGKIMKIGVYSIILGFILFLSFPKYIDAAVVTFQETINVITSGEDSTGRKDERLGFSRTFIVNLIMDNPIFGTGFDNKWRTHDGDEQGYETSDYPFLAALAMKGLIGVLIFLPVYFVLIGTIKKDIKFIKKNSFSYDNVEFFLIIFFILYFTYDLVLYMNWFTPVSLSRDYEWLCLLAMYLAARELFYKNLKRQVIENSNNNNRSL